MDAQTEKFLDLGHSLELEDCIESKKICKNSVSIKK